MTDQIPLGQATSYPDHYSPDLLYAIARIESREALGLGEELPFHGSDIWNAWELTWLNLDGVPQVAVADIRVPATSPNIVESKSLKLYLGSFAMTRYSGTDAVSAVIRQDLTDCIGAEVSVALSGVDGDHAIHQLPGNCIDASPARCEAYDIDPGLLSTREETAEESLHSHLLRSLCPVTDQPDIGSVLIAYAGRRIDPAGLLQYIVSYRQHNDFHEACVERMFVDILEKCQPQKLTVYAAFQRRGGIDINPFRSNFEDDPPNLRLWRQ
jgi:7-cyano-7-deazaguanine reductase